MYDPAVPLHERVDVSDAPSMTSVGFRVHVRPVPEETVRVSETVPVKLLTLSTVMVDVPVSPSTIATLVGLAEIAKSNGGVILNVTSTEWVNGPLVPVTVTV